MKNEAQQSTLLMARLYYQDSNVIPHNKRVGFISIVINAYIRIPVPYAV
ncbi:MAG: hypothetical protein ABIN89_24920 [Chitinophagaceae bacterium]